MTHPEHSNIVERAVRRTIRPDHTKHAMELPVDEEDNEEVVRIEESLEMSATAFLHCEENHDSHTESHNPSGNTWACSEVGKEENDDFIACLGRLRDCKFCKVDHVGSNVNDGKYHYGPSSRLVEGDGLIKGDEIVQRGATKQRYEVTADGQEDENNVDMENQRSCTSDSWRRGQREQTNYILK
jgi:hypothetical protein